MALHNVSTYVRPILRRLVCVDNPLNVAYKANNLELQLSSHSNKLPNGQLFNISRCIFTSSVQLTFSFFNKYSGDELWKGVTSVSNQGRNRGRATRVRKKIDFNRGQVVGRGKVRINLPGLNIQPVDSDGLKKIKVIEGEDEIRAQRLKEAKERQLKSIMRRKLDPLDRGWSGTKWPGRSIGPPDPVHGETFEGFDSIVLEQKRVHHMSSHGRVQQYSIFVVTGNKKGIVGFGLAKSLRLQEAMRRAKNNAGRRLMFVELHNGHTVFHDFVSNFYNAKVYVKKENEGYGLDCKNVIKEICKVIGIKDISCKVEGASGNVQNTTKSFLLGLLRQKTHQQLADEKQLYVVERKHERLGFPTIIASPSSGIIRKESEISETEELDFNLYTMGGQVMYERPKKYPFYFKLDGFNTYLKKMKSARNRQRTVERLLADYDSLDRFYGEVYKPYIPEPKTLLNKLKEVNAL